MLDYNSSGNDITVKQVYSHATQVLDLAPSPFAKDLLVTCGKPKGEAMTATLWKMGDIDGDEAVDGDTPTPLVALAELPQQKLPVSKYVPLQQHCLVQCGVCVCV